MAKMLDTATRFHVYVIRGKATPLPCKHEYRERREWARSRLPVRGKLLAGGMSEDMATGYAWGWNAAHGIYPGQVSP
jgi:hypothetical protein